MPTGVNTLIVGHAYGLDQRFIATAIVWSTAAALTPGLVIAAVRRGRVARWACESRVI